MRFSFALATVTAIVSLALAAPAEPEESLAFRENGELSHAAFLKESNSTDADMLGPFEVRTLEDGTVIKETKREVLELVRRQPASYPCGSGCDGMPFFCSSVPLVRVSPLIQVERGSDVSPTATRYPPGGPVNWFTCADDAKTIYWVSNTELRYSPRCRAVWARGPYYLWNIIRSYTQSSGGSIRKQRETQVYNVPGSDQFTVMLNDAGLYGAACWGPWNGPNAPIKCTGRY